MLKKKPHTERENEERELPRTLSARWSIRELRKDKLGGEGGVSGKKGGEKEKGAGGKGEKV